MQEQKAWYPILATGGFVLSFCLHSKWRTVSLDHSGEPIAWRIYSGGQFNVQCSAFNVQCLSFLKTAIAK